VVAGAIDCSLFIVGCNLFVLVVVLRLLGQHEQMLPLSRAQRPILGALELHHNYIIEIEVGCQGTSVLILAARR
jgi:hypothetical protein